MPYKISLMIVFIFMALYSVSAKASGDTSRMAVDAALHCAHFYNKISVIWGRQQGADKKQVSRVYARDSNLLEIRASVLAKKYGMSLTEYRSMESTAKANASRINLYNQSDRYAYRVLDLVDNCNLCLDKKSGLDSSSMRALYSRILQNNLY